MNKEALEKRREELLSELDEIRSKLEDVTIGKLKEQYIGQYLQIDDSYIYCYAIFPSRTYLVFRGVGFSFNDSEYVDDAYFSWSAMENINIFNDDTKNIQIISKEQYYQILQERIESIKGDVGEFITLMKN